MVQHPAGPAGPVPALFASRDEGARAAASLRAAVPEGTDPPGDESEPHGADPGGNSGGLLSVRSADAALSRDAPGSVPQDAGQDLLQARGPLAGRLAQAEHGDRPGLLRREGRDRGLCDGDRSGTMGFRLGPRDELLRHAGEGVHGPSLLRPEAVPKVRDAPLRGRGDPESERSDEHREEDPGPGSEPSRLPGRRDLGSD